LIKDDRMIVITLRCSSAKTGQKKVVSLTVEAESRAYESKKIVSSKDYVTEVF
jgi:hypothetical protein